MLCLQDLLYVGGSLTWQGEGACMSVLCVFDTTCRSRIYLDVVSTWLGHT
jgi:hypothetical protein